MSDTAVRLSFELSKDGQKAISRDYEITVPGQSKNKAEGNPKPQIIPELLSWNGGQGSCTLPKEISVAGDAPFCDEFIRELQAILPKGYTVSASDQPENAHIKFTRQKGKASEAYTLRIDDKGVSISSKATPGSTGAAARCCRCWYRTRPSCPAVKRGMLRAISCAVLCWT